MTAWQDRATCVTAPWVDPSWFFPEGSGRRAQVQSNQAKSVCADCPVTRQCLLLALEAEQTEEETHGTFGGMTARERKRLGTTGRRNLIAELTR